MAENVDDKVDAPMEKKWNIYFYLTGAFIVWNLILNMYSWNYLWLACMFDICISMFISRRLK